ncbi:MAG: cytidylate kinase-like family protein [Lachnospiraceae bacterium]|nr:cytidylate kinase-like family protein [Lachnospiraceae bacterium]
MEKQLIISIGREFGSGGHEIAEILAEKFGLELYDKNLLEEIANEKNIKLSSLEKFDEVPRNYFFTRSVRGHSNSMAENLANMQFDFLRKKAAEGKSFVVVGRCAEHVLKDYPALISIFILGDWEHKVERIAKLYNMPFDEAENFVFRKDRKRKYYHNTYCKGKWGDSRNYDISVNSSKLGEEETANMLADYIIKRQNRK